MYEYLWLEEYSLEDVYPQITMEEVKDFLEDYQKFDTAELKKHKSVDELPDDIQKLLKQVYISKVLKNKEAIKARFQRYMKINRFSENRKIIEENYGEDVQKIDVIFQNSKDNLTEALIYVEVLDKGRLKRIKNAINSYNESNNKQSINAILLICGSVDRTITVELEQSQSRVIDFKIRVFVEYKDADKEFEDEDLVIVDDLEIKGFNFGSLDEVLSLIKTEKGKGKYTIYTQDTRGFKKVIWEGYVFPNKILY